MKFRDLLTRSYLTGEVELENLPLKKDALSHFGLPIQAYSGSIGKIKLQVPVRQFRTAPWCINIEKVYIICGPVNLEEVKTSSLCKISSEKLIRYQFVAFSGTTMLRSSLTCTINKRISTISRLNGERSMRTVPITQVPILDG